MLHCSFMKLNALISWRVALCDQTKHLGALAIIVKNRRNVNSFIGKIQNFGSCRPMSITVYNCHVFYRHVSLLLHLLYWLINHEFNPNAIVMRFNGSWHGLPKHYEVCQLAFLKLLAVPQILLDDISLFRHSSTWLHLEGLKKAGKNCVYNPADLETALPELRRSVTKKALVRRYNIPWSTLLFLLSSKVFKIFFETSASV